MTSTLTQQTADPCLPILLKSGLLDDTPGAPLSLLDRKVGGLAKFGEAQTGQLVKANIDKRTARTFGTECEAEWGKTVQQLVRHENRHWWEFWK